MTLAEVYKEATRLGFSPKWCADTNTVQIDGHRWDRWAALRNCREPKPFVSYRTKSLRGNVAGRIQAGYSVVHAAHA
ncbi:transposase [Burkholderia ambifaria]